MFNKNNKSYIYIILHGERRKNISYEMFLKLIDEAEEKGYGKIVIASANSVAATPEEIKAIKEHLEVEKVRIETKDGTSYYSIMRRSMIVPMMCPLG